MRYVDKSQRFEAFLASLNAAARELPEPVHDPRSLGTHQIVGLPRSGTTLLFQLLAHTGAVGYPSNVMAFFHFAPWVGARLQVHLARTQPSLSFQSIGGRTREPLDPHEFGYFWRRVCGHTKNSLVQDAEPLPVRDLQRELDLVAAEFDQPVVYKNFLAIVHVERMRKLHGATFAVVRRSTLDVVHSLLTLRRSLGIPDSEPLGMTPTVQLPPDRDIAVSVARQVVALEQDLDASGLYSAKDAEVIDYEELCRDPRGQVERLLVLMKASTSGVTRLPLSITAPRSRANNQRVERAIAQARQDLGS